MPDGYWPTDRLLNMFELARDNGSADATLPSPSDANSFRFALHHFRRTHEEWAGYTISCSNTLVRVAKRVEAPEPIITLPTPASV